MASHIFLSSCPEIWNIFYKYLAEILGDAFTFVHNIEAVVAKTFFLRIDKPCTYFLTYGLARNSPLIYAVAGIRTHVSGVAPSKTISIHDVQPTELPWVRQWQRPHVLKIANLSRSHTRAIAT